MARHGELVIPLTSDSAFLQLLSGALTALTDLYQTILAHCEDEVSILTRMVSTSARPRSGSGRSGRQTDLDTWRAIFQLWVDTQVFESLTERSKGELDVHESESRLKWFADAVAERGYTDRKHMRMAKSRDAFDKFYALNVLLLDLKKVRRRILGVRRRF